MSGYTQETDPDTTSRALVKDIDISPKHARELCRSLRGRSVDSALQYLDEVIELKRAVPFRRYNKQVTHKRGTGPGRYPVKAAKFVKKAIEEAQHNAEYKGLDSDSMRIHTISSHRGQPFDFFRPRAFGRSGQWKRERVNIEVILEEIK
ncbi:MAG: 50S ribosomal protein L22 [Thermoplasmata archaeon]|uniref:Large ribosomal subunit protein uL22 n=1 Tax=Candidatus Sysuiplasma superficiale TaxID=2823368 RepID=A0A8J7YTI3_9ARCH|nr:50S ribosomal protein L22 [Candidatus Sysuiplasma superficiale]MBX8644324.1 50S ribosomal protein L22 [Candidatus Sysuiplasma superficiale]MCL4347078.1 50S ribosomal protein L22 [Candidatus Thermoplasmatota archaeon]